MTGAPASQAGLSSQAMGPQASPPKASIPSATLAEYGRRLAEESVRRAMNAKASKGFDGLVEIAIAEALMSSARIALKLAKEPSQ
jgi:hypothetical protein